MLYVLTGHGSIPPKEIVTTMEQLLAREEQRAQEQGLTDIEFWLAVEFDHITDTHPCWRSLYEWSQREDVFITATADAIETLVSENDSALLVLPVSPDFDDAQDERLINVIDEATSSGKQTFCLNGQMYEVQLEGEREEPTSTDDLDGMTLPQLKKLAKELGVTPSDWRTKGVILEAIRASQSDTSKGMDTLSDTIEVSNETGEEPVAATEPEAELLEPTAEAEPETATSQQAELDESAIEEIVTRVVREQLTSILLDVLNKLG